MLLLKLDDLHVQSRQLAVLRSTHQRSMRHGLQRRCPHCAEVYRSILVIVHLANHRSAMYAQMVALQHVSSCVLIWTEMQSGDEVTSLLRSGKHAQSLRSGMLPLQ